MKTNEEGGDMMKIVNDVRKKRKGKAVSVESKVSGANIKEWVRKKIIKKNITYL